MSENLNYAVSASSPIIRARNDSPVIDSKNLTVCSFSGGACALNGDTRAGSGNYAGEWYYSWYAATGESGSSSTVGETEWSICPAGWRLPANSNINLDKSYSSIANSYDLTANSDGARYLEYPFMMKLPGSYRAGSEKYIGTYGQYWSSTALNTTSAYNFFVGSSLVALTDNDVKYYSGSVRCVAL